MNFKPPRRPAGRIGALLFLCLVSSVSCGPRFAQRELIINREGKPPLTISVELARTSGERSRGLMYRKSLDDGKAMLFIFDRDERLSFWMKNTFIPLSIAFISRDGRILEIRDLRPLDEAAVRSSRSVRYALEAPQGWFGRAGVAVGDRLVLDGGL